MLLGPARRTPRCWMWARRSRRDQLAVRLVPIDLHALPGPRAVRVEPIVESARASVRNAPGNYLAFFSSFDYLDQVADAFRARHPHVPMWRQSRSMAEAERNAFLARFEPGGLRHRFRRARWRVRRRHRSARRPAHRRVRGHARAAAGQRINEEMQQRMEARFGAGYNYTYLYPGLQKVVQAAGRVIRTTTGPRRVVSDR